MAVDDPAFSHYRDVAEIPPHVSLEIGRFFEDYKALENKLSVVDGLYDAKRALEVVRAALSAYRAKSAWQKG